MASGLDVIFVGIKGTVLALDRATGTIQWRTELQGSDFVNVIQQDGDLYAATRGRLLPARPAQRRGAVVQRAARLGLRPGHPFPVGPRPRLPPKRHAWMRRLPPPPLPRLPDLRVAQSPNSSGLPGSICPVYQGQDQQIETTLCEG